MFNYKHERRSKTKSKSSKLDRRKLKKFLKERGISSLEAMVVLDSTLTPRANDRKHRENRRSDSMKHSVRNHDRQSNGRRHTKHRIEKKRRKKSSRDKSKESSVFMPHAPKMNNGHRKHSHTQSSSTTPLPSRKSSDGKEKKETEASKIIRKMLENMDSDNNANTSSRGRGIKKQPTSSSSSSNDTDDEMLRKSDFAQYLLEVLSSGSLDSSSDSDSPSTDDNDSGTLIGHESPTIINLVDSDDETEVNESTTEANRSTTEATMPITTTLIETAPTRIMPIKTTPSTSPTILENDHHIRVKHFEKEKRPRSPKPSRKKNHAPKVHWKNHRTITHHIQSNERINSPSSSEDEEDFLAEAEDSESTIVSGNSSETPEKLISPYNNYTYVTKYKRRRKIRPPKLMRKIFHRAIPSNERKKSKETALKFIVTEEASIPNCDNIYTPEKRKSPLNMSLKEKGNSHRFELLTCETHESPRCTTHESPRFATYDSPRCATNESPRCATNESPRCGTHESPRCATHESPRCATHESPRCATHESPRCKTYQSEENWEEFSNLSDCDNFSEFQHDEDEKKKDAERNSEEEGDTLDEDFTDIILPEIFVPQTVSATVITEPILGPGYLRNTVPCKSYLFGDVNVLVSPIKYLNCEDELRSMPWVVNTMGYSHGFGLELIAAILRALNPTDLIQIHSTKSVNNVGTTLTAEVVNGFQFNILKNEIQYMQNECTYSTYNFNTMSTEKQQDEWSKSQKDLQNAMILSKLGGILQGNVNWITDVRPL
ncbi:Polynucleotide 5'-hydroxyl-kinase NOL9, partial [Pseudolycoriella hygida]